MDHLLPQGALPYAVTLARRMHLGLVLVRILQSTAPRGHHLVQEPEAQASLERAAEELRGQSVEVDTLVSSTLLGTVASRILDIADRRACTAIVMSTHGRSGPGRWLYGSVAEEVLRQSRRLVVLVSTVCDRRWTDAAPFRVLVPLDGSELADSVVEPTLATTGMDAELILLGVLALLNAEAAANIFEDVDREEIDTRASLGTMADQLSRDGTRSQVQILRGPAAATIAQIAQEQDLDLIAMATHGRTRLARLVLGSVATETLQRVPCPSCSFVPVRCPRRLNPRQRPL
jgi:nucleotide-binding universal stress UspA family protein